MKEFPQFAVFISMFFTGFLALNYCVFSGITFLLGLPHNTVFYVLMFVAAASHSSANLIERTVSNSLTRGFYTAAAGWIGISFYLLCFLVIYGILSFVKIPRETAGILIGVLTALVSTYSVVNALLLDIKKIEIPLNGLEKDLRMVQLSDIHISSIRNSGYMERIVVETNNLKLIL